MTKDQINNLKPGDEVFWEDPDDGLCSRAFKIYTITWTSEDENAVFLSDVDGTGLECFIEELH